MAAFKASPAHKEWEAAEGQHQRQRRRQQRPLSNKPGRGRQWSPV